MAENESEKSASASSRRTSSWGRDPGQLPPSVQETARDRRQGPPSCQDNCLLLGSVAKVNPSPGTVSGDKSVFPRAALLFCYLILDWWWDPGDPQIPLPPSSLFPPALCLYPPPQRRQRCTLNIGHVGTGGPCLRVILPLQLGHAIHSLPLGTSQDPLRAEAGPGGKIAR